MFLATTPLHTQNSIHSSDKTHGQFEKLDCISDKFLTSEDVLGVFVQPTSQQDTFVDLEFLETIFLTSSSSKIKAHQPHRRRRGRGVLRWG